MNIYIGILIKPPKQYLSQKSPGFPGQNQACLSLCLLLIPPSFKVQSPFQWSRGHILFRFVDIKSSDSKFFWHFPRSLMYHSTSRFFKILHYFCYEGIPHLSFNVHQIYFTAFLVVVSSSTYLMYLQEKAHINSGLVMLEPKLSVKWVLFFKLQFSQVLLSQLHNLACLLPNKNNLFY